MAVRLTDGIARRMGKDCPASPLMSGFLNLDQMDEWPFNGKNLWASLMLGQKIAIVIGIPITFYMTRGYHEIIDYMIPNIIVRIPFYFVGFFFVPYVYVRAFGMWIAVFIEVIRRMVK